MSDDRQALQQAIALFYDGETAPNVTAKGSGDIADEIIALAREHEVPLFENRELLNLLKDLEVGDEIPETLYLCIAQVMAFAWHLQGKRPDESTGNNANTE